MESLLSNGALSVLFYGAYAPSARKAEGFSGVTLPSGRENAAPPSGRGKPKGLFGRDPAVRKKNRSCPLRGESPMLSIVLLLLRKLRGTF